MYTMLGYCFLTSLINFVFYLFDRVASFCLKSERILTAFAFRNTI